MKKILRNLFEIDKLGAPAGLLIEQGNHDGKLFFEYLTNIQELGADIQMLPEIFTKLMDDKDVSDQMKRADLQGDYLAMNWSLAEKGVETMIKDNLSKK